MKITIESTQKFALVHGVLCRLWTGTTSEGNACEVLVPFIKASEPATTAELARELQDQGEYMPVPAEWYTEPTPVSN